MDPVDLSRGPQGMWDSHWDSVGRVVAVAGLGGSIGAGSGPTAGGIWPEDSQVFFVPT